MYMHTTCIHTYIHMYIYMYIHMYICMYRTVHTYIHAHVHAYMHACIHTYIHTYIHTCIQTYIHIYTHTYIHTCILYIHSIILVPQVTPHSRLSLFVAESGLGSPGYRLGGLYILMVLVCLTGLTSIIIFFFASCHTKNRLVLSDLGLTHLDTPL